MEDEEVFGEDKERGEVEVEVTCSGLHHKLNCAESAKQLQLYLVTGSMLKHLAQLAHPICNCKAKYSARVIEAGISAHIVWVTMISVQGAHWDYGRWGGLWRKETEKTGTLRLWPCTLLYYLGYFLSFIQVLVADGVFIDQAIWAKIGSSKKHSIFVKDLAVAVFGTEVLKTSSVEGKLSPRYKKVPGKVAKPALCPRMLNGVKGK